MHVCTHAIHTNLKGNFQLVYMCLIWLLQPEEKKLQQNPEGLNCHKRMDVKKAKPVLWTRFPAGVLQGSCLSPAGLCPGQTLLSWHVDTTSQCSALSFPSFSWKIPAETTSCLLFCCQVVLGVIPVPCAARGWHRAVTSVSTKPCPPTLSLPWAHKGNTRAGPRLLGWPHPKCWQRAVFTFHGKHLTNVIK